jgi:hypothetical protein
VIREAMRGKGMVALGRLVLSKRERVIACSLCRPTNFWRRERASGCPDISRTDKLGAANSLTSLSRNRGRSRADEYPGRRRSRARAPKRRLRVFQSGMLPDSRALQKINSRREDGRCSRGTRVLPKRALKGNLTLATWRGKVRDFLQDDLVFDPDAVGILLAAFDAAWQSIKTSRARLSDKQTELVRATLAKYIIEQARRGELDERRLSEGALLHLARSNLRYPTDDRK